MQAFYGKTGSHQDNAFDSYLLNSGSSPEIDTYPTKC